MVTGFFRQRVADKKAKGVINVKFLFVYRILEELYSLLF